jgi:hypothetical protein
MKRIKQLWNSRQIIFIRTNAMKICNYVKTNTWVKYAWLISGFIMLTFAFILGDREKYYLFLLKIGLSMLMLYMVLPLFSFEVSVKTTINILMKFMLIGISPISLVFWLTLFLGEEYRLRFLLIPIIITISSVFAIIYFIDQFIKSFKLKILFVDEKNRKKEKSKEYINLISNITVILACISGVFELFKSVFT